MVDVVMAPPMTGPTALANAKMMLVLAVRYTACSRGVTSVAITSAGENFWVLDDVLVEHYLQCPMHLCPEKHER